MTFPGLFIHLFSTNFKEYALTVDWLFPVAVVVRHDGDLHAAGRGEVP